MSVLSIRGLNKAYGETEVLRDISLDVEEGEHIALVGGNGMGKSTLLHLLAGNLHADSGQIQTFPEYLRVGLLEQSPTVENSGAQQGGTENPEFRAALTTLGAACSLAETAADAPQILSGGERIKLALARLLAEHPDLLLLDEPTNNLDFNGITTLVEAVCEYPGTLLVVSHDRWFLDQTVTRVLELEDGGITEYYGNYTDYRDEKKRRFGERLHQWEEGVKQQERLNDSIRRAKGWADKAQRDSTKIDDGSAKMGAKEFKRRKAEKLERAAQNQVRRLERLREETGPRPREEKKAVFSVGDADKRGKRILEVCGLGKSFGERVLFSGCDFTLLRGEHAALFGANGCGKTTFLRILQGDLEPDQGFVRVSPASVPFVLSQNILDLPTGRTSLDYLRELSGVLTGEQRTLLNNMGLTARHLTQRIGTLSLGEQMKVKLAELIFAKRDFIVLDEPTNYLDLHARETLEDTLADYNGTLLVVSHDITFLQRVCDKTLVFDEGRIRRLELSFAEYLDKQE